MGNYELDLDGGNTRLKYRLRGDVECQGWVLDADWCPCFTQLFARYGYPRKVRFAAVWKAERKQRLLKLLKAMGVDVKEAVVVQGCEGLRLGYKEPSRLGVDRWLAMLAARDFFPSESLLVVDCGTAVTIDYLLADGRHQGGYIVPGIRLCTEVLGQQTERVGTEGLDSDAWEFGCNTAEAVRHGAVQQICALIVQSLRSSCLPETRLLLTGGDAGIIANGLEQQTDLAIKLLPELVLDGLKIALPK